MKKIGIITEYYNSKNYGGVLQAYALCKVIENMGYQCEQIPYMKLSSVNDIQTSSSIATKLKKAINPVTLSQYLKDKIESKIMEGIFDERTKAFAHFRDVFIPHNKNVYADDTIKECLDDYDCFITGSDQVWNPAFYSSAYLLDFVPKDRVKMSYAASLSVFSLIDEQRARFRESLANYNAVSVREKDAVSLLQDLSPVPVEWVLDPTLLLEREQWEGVSSDRTVDEKYIFAYFLGEDLVHRQLTEEFAREHNLRIISMPYIWGKYRKCDRKFGDLRLFDVTPQDFLAFVKNADYIFTDSFHAVVFSILFQKQFFAFQRTDFEGMGSRLYSLTQLFDVQSHYCDTKEKQNLKYMDNQETIRYQDSHAKFSLMKKKSILFLKKNLLF